ncbi:MAG: DUF3048 domain-containing protein [Firmicutes bacterium]|nr:DUF3048 domain-containing protein [Bacillota bacterium]
MKRATALILALIMLLSLSACGTPAAENNTADTNVINNSNEAAPEPEPEPEPEPPKPVYTNPLTGEVTEEDISGVRPISIMMNNISYAMPMHGNSEADILIEMNAEGNITRMLGIFSQITSKIGKIGSIRSARPYYLDWALGFDMVYISVGGSDTANKQIKSRNVTHINGMGYTNIFYRDQDRKAAGYAYEHTMFITGERFENGYKDINVRKTHNEGFDYGLRFTDQAQTASGSAANKVDVKMNSSKHTYFDYDSASRKYLISEHGDKYIDGNTKEQVAVKNVLVLYTKYWHEYSGSSTLLADMTGGKGVYICEGKMIDINWKLAEGKGLTLTKADGGELALMPGHSFICCPNSSGGSVTVE